MQNTGWKKTSCTRLLTLQIFIYLSIFLFEKYIFSFKCHWLIPLYFFLYDALCPARAGVVAMCLVPADFHSLL